MGGCTYVYLKLVYNDLFAGEPEIKFTVFGKPVFDPRTNTTTFSSNPALIVNDILTDPEFGVGDASVNQESLISAANVCDESVLLASGQYEARYAAHYHCDTSTAPGDVIETVLSACGGRMSRIGGEWHIIPAFYQGPTGSFDASDLIGEPSWSPVPSYRERINRVTGTYIAPNYPFNVSGNLYDTNGYYNGTTQNNFQFSFQPTNYPMYACDTLHGYASDQYLNEDGGIQLPKELGQQCVLSVAQAQRLAKIYLLRNRQGGTGTLQMAIRAYQLQPGDTFRMNFAGLGWTDKLLEVKSTTLRVDTTGDAPKLVLDVAVQDIDASVYQWSTAEELTVYDVPASPSQLPYTPAPPTNMMLSSSAATAIVNPDGSVRPRIEVQWDTPLDGLVRQIQIQYQVVGASTWDDAGSVDASLNTGYINGVVAGQTYNVRIRSVRSTGASSTWVTINGFTAGLVLSVQTQTGVGIGSLLSEAYSDGTASILCEPFTALVGSLSLSVTPTPSIITGLSQGTLYYLYYVDSTFTGGNVTPIATTNTADYRGLAGRFLIDSIVTRSSPTSGGGSGGGSGGSGGRIYPSSYSDIGTRSTGYPSAAYDGDTATVAVVSGSSRSKATTSGGGGSTPPPGDPDSGSGSFTIQSAQGECIFQGFPATYSSSDATLTVVATTAISDGYVSISANVGSSSTTMFDSTVSVGTTTYTMTILANTAFSTVTLDCVALANDPTSANQSHVASLSIAEIYIDY